MKKRRDCKRERLWFGLRPVSGGVRLREETRAKDTEGDVNLMVMAKAEKVVAIGDLAAIRRFIIGN